MGIFGSFKKEMKQARKASDDNERLYYQIKNLVENRGFVSVDEQNGYFFFDSIKYPGTLTPEVFKIDGIEYYSIVEDGEDVVSGGLSISRAAVGSLIAGPAGMILGGLTGKKKSAKVVKSLTLNFRISGSYNVAKLITKPTKTDSINYMQTVGLLDRTKEFFDEVLYKDQIEEVTESENISVADELMKYSKLRDEGIITEEEFIKLKSKLI